MRVNSGGVLGNMQGQVVGIPTLGVNDATGPGFAVSSNQAVAFAKQPIQSSAG